MRFNNRRFISLLYWFFYGGVAVIFLNLSMWQYNRAVEKSLLLKKLMLVEQVAEPVFFSEKFSTTEVLFFLDGHFIKATEFLINARFLKGQIGYEVVSLFQATDGQRYWVNRGWIKRYADRSFNDWQTSFKKQRLEFYVKSSDQTNSTGVDVEHFNGQFILPYLHVGHLNKLSHPLLGSDNFVLYALADQPNVFLVDSASQKAMLQKRIIKHYMYVGQWVLIALVWLFMGFIFKRAYEK